MNDFLTENLHELYGTSDFGLAAYLIVTNQAELDNIVPLLREIDSPLKPLRFQFRFKPINGNTVETLKQCEFNFINQDTTVEPVAYQSVRRRLHERISRMAQEITKGNNHNEK